MTNLQDYIKLNIKVLDNNVDKVRWTHFCYVNRELYNRYLYENELTSNSMNEVISRWCKEDFNVELMMSSSKDIHLLRALVKDFYKRAHPDLFIDSRTDRQGWLRLWVTRKMKEELRIYGEERNKRANG